MLRIGCLSAANIAPKALIEPATALDDVSITAVAARDRTRAEEFAATHGIPRVEENYAALCTSDEVDAIYIATPAALHRRWTLAALAAGKHVLCEKPIANNADEAHEMVDAATDAGLLLMEAFHWRYHPMADRIAELVATLGPIESMSACFDVAIDDPANIRYQPDLGGGALMDLGVYPLQWLRFVARSEPDVLAASAQTGPPGIDVTLAARLRFGAVEADLHCSMDPATDRAARLIVIGRDGALTAENPLAPQLGNLLTVERTDGTVESETSPVTSTYLHQLVAFRDAVSTGDTVPTSGQDSIATMRAVDAMYTAAGLKPRGR